MTTFINKQGFIDSSWNVSFKESSVNIYATSEKAALQKAVEYFKPKKRERSLFQITLLEEYSDPGNQGQFH